MEVDSADVIDLPASLKVHGVYVGGLQIEKLFQPWHHWGS